MKNLILTLAILMAAITAISQEVCDMYYPYEEGEEMVMISYDKKEKVSGYQMMKLQDKSSNGAHLFFEVYDEKGKESGKMDYQITCDGDALLIDMDAYLPNDQMSSVENVEVQLEGEPLEMPKSLSVGQELKSGSITAKTLINGVPFSTVNVEIYDRKVISKETISTSVGDFECYKLTQSIKTNMGLIKIEASSEDYWCPGEGLIKSVSYNKGGKMTGYQVRGNKSEIR